MDSNHQLVPPENFRFPNSYLKIVDNNEDIDSLPWELLYKNYDLLLNYYTSMQEIYTNHSLIPFARACDLSGYFNDGYVVLACFDGEDNTGNPKVYFHDYGQNSWGLCEDRDISWEERYFIANFDEWIKLAKNESIQYKAEIAEIC